MSEWLILSKKISTQRRGHQQQREQFHQHTIPHIQIKSLRHTMQGILEISFANQPSALDQTHHRKGFAIVRTRRSTVNKTVQFPSSKRHAAIPTNMSQHILIYIVLNINIMHIVTHLPYSSMTQYYTYTSALYFYFMLFYVTSSPL